MTGPTSAILGRDLEIGVVSGFLDRVESGPGALVIEGPAGIGKTTIRLAGVGNATNRGYRELMSRGAESEARLSYATLGDLLGDIPETVLRGMPIALRRALDGVLLRAEVPGGSLGQRAVSLT